MAKPSDRILEVYCHANGDPLTIFVGETDEEKALAPGGPECGTVIRLDHAEELHLRQKLAEIAMHRNWT